MVLFPSTVQILWAAPGSPTAPPIPDPAGEEKKHIVGRDRQQNSRGQNHVSCDKTSQSIPHKKVLEISCSWDTEIA